MFRKAIKSTLARFDLELVHKHSDNNPETLQAKQEFANMYEIVRMNTMVRREALFSLYYQLLHCERNSIPGAYVECGVWKGGAVGIMALVNLRHGKQVRDLHLFDAFSDICQPDEKLDGPRAVKEARSWSKEGASNGKLEPLKGFYDHKGGAGTVEINKKLLIDKISYAENHVKFHEGWFQDTLPEQHKDIDKIAVLRLDGDWYASTKICLDYLFEKVVSGGFVIFDDYGTYDGCHKAVDDFIAQYPRPLYLNYVDNDIRYIIMP